VFGPRQVVSSTFLAFGASWLAQVRPRRLRLGVTRAVLRLERALIARGRLRGEYVYAEAVKT
jgi:hypothetical protein